MPKKTTLHQAKASLVAKQYHLVKFDFSLATLHLTHVNLS